MICSIEVCIGGEKLNPIPDHPREQHMHPHPVPVPVASVPIPTPFQGLKRGFSCPWTSAGEFWTSAVYSSGTKLYKIVAVSLLIGRFPEFQKVIINYSANSPPLTTSGFGD